MSRSLGRPMHRVLLIGSSTNWHSRELSRAAKGRCVIETISFEHLQSSIGIEGCSPIDSEHDRVIVRAMPPGSLEQVIFRMDALAIWQQRGVHIFNPPKALEAAIDKYLCLARLAAKGLPIPETIVCQTADQGMQAFEILGSDVVIKPIFGSEGRSLMRIDSSDFAERVFRWLERTAAVIYVQQFITSPGHDMRVLVVGGEPFAIKRSNQLDWRMNAARGAKCHAFRPSTEQVELAFAAMQETGCTFGGVDLIQNQAGKNFILEVNAVPGWQAVAKHHHVDIAAKVLDVILADNA